MAFAEFDTKPLTVEKWVKVYCFACWPCAHIVKKQMKTIRKTLLKAASIII
jgi:hypothetical protein